MAGDKAGQVWLVTGAATGLGLAIAECALAQGHRIVATARGKDRLEALVARDPARVVACELDVTSTTAIHAVVEHAIARFGRIDVLVNNAAGGLMGAVEESTAEEIRAIFDANLFGPWELVRAVLPYMRGQSSGTIVNVSSFAALCAFTGLGAYSASKFALEGMSDSLASEVSQWGIRVIIAEPGGLATEFASHSIRFSQASEAYEPLLGDMRRLLGKFTPPDLGDPAVAAEIIARAVAEAEPPLRLPLGADAVAMAHQSANRRAADLTAWEAAGKTVTPG